MTENLHNQEPAEGRFDNRGAIPAPSEKTDSQVKRSPSPSNSGLFESNFSDLFHKSDGLTLDPNSKDFSPAEWAIRFMQLKSRDPDRYRPRSAGVSFHNLSVHGFGSPINYQKDFFNVFLQITDLLSGLINRRDQKIEILRGHNGLVRSGEMLLVLGRPGR
ncbi:hypothetical protein VI817_001498 [Penicillium citrinum]|nr:hypothetical protein VI817_001498 [Penicillium citrinum]